MDKAGYTNGTSGAEGEETEIGAQVTIDHGEWDRDGKKNK